MAHTSSSIQSWIDSYTFIDNATASRDILRQILGELPEHKYTYGPFGTTGYKLKISGPVVNETFIVRDDS